MTRSCLSTYQILLLPFPAVIGGEEDPGTCLGPLRVISDPLATKWWILGASRPEVTYRPIL